MADDATDALDQCFARGREPTTDLIPDRLRMFGGGPRACIAAESSLAFLGDPPTPPSYPPPHLNPHCHPPPNPPYTPRTLNPP